ncbi:MAG: Cupin superfamily protein [Solirubrobacterales bacterium]|nr:Cupin superfamily protein [Solirubrobacterales bacterium]
MTDTAQEPVAGGQTHVRYDLDEARRCFGTAPFKLGHDLATDPRFSLDALAALAERLPTQFIEHNAGNKAVVVADNDSIPQAALSPAQIIRQIEERPGFVALPTTVPGLPRQAGYQELFEELLEELAPMIPGGLAAIYDHHAVIFVASGGNTTPSHVDPEPSFLLHVRGVKRFSIGRHADPATEQRELEAFYRHQGRNTPAVPVDVQHVDLEPGEALHVPPVKPHWVQNGPEVAISFSVGFQTAEDHRRMGVHQFNSRLRRLGLSPAPYGAAPRRDRLKGGVMYSAFRARNRLLRRPG